MALTIPDDVDPTVHYRQRVAVTKTVLARIFLQRIEVSCGGRNTGKSQIRQNQAGERVEFLRVAQEVSTDRTHPEGIFGWKV